MAMAATVTLLLLLILRHVHARPTSMSACVGSSFGEYS
jgi:hypothetical protein